MKIDTKGTKKGFTLIELLIVIAIIAILSIVVVLTLNPAEMLRRSRDSNRLSDLSTFQSAMNLYAQDKAVSGGSLGLGTSSVIYVSIPDPTASTSAGSDCSNLGFPAGGAYHCAGPSFFRKTDGTGWIPVNLASTATGAPLGQLPTDPTNNLSSGEYYEYTTDGTNWKMAAVPESAQQSSQIASFTSGTNQNLFGGFPNQGWVAVPGNSTFGTHNFAVMKYDAVCSDGNGNYLNDTASADTTNYHIYDDSVASGNIPCTSGRSVAALPGGYPIADIAETTAKTRCQAIGAHLLTNDEYMTIVTDAVSQGSNWNGGVVGASYVYSGHNNNSPANASPADSNDANGYAGTNSATNQKRTYTLSNGSVIWDMAGNVWQEVQRSVGNQGDLTTTINTPVCSNNAASWNWCEYGTSGSTNVTSWTADVTKALTAPANSSWYSSQGMGQLLTWGPGGTSQGTNAFIRSGGWGDGSTGGPFAVSLRWGTGSASYGVGFRCAR